MQTAIKHQPSQAGPMQRLNALAAEALAQYHAEIRAGGEPVYPAWIDDVAALASAPVADANRWRWISAQYDDMKTSEVERFLELLGLDASEPYARLGEFVDQMTGDAAKPAASDAEDIPDFGGGSGNKARRRAAALRSQRQESAPVAGEADEDLAPPECPITRRPLFMAIEHPELGMVPTYGGPFDSYTIPYMDGEAHQPWHERELFVRRYDHDLGGWRDDESIPLRVIHEDVLHELQDAALQTSEADATRQAIRTCGSKVIKALAAIARADGPDTRKEGDPELIYRSPVMDEVVRIRQAYDELNAALSAQPGAQKLPDNLRRPLDYIDPTAAQKQGESDA